MKIKIPNWGYHLAFGIAFTLIAAPTFQRIFAMQPPEEALVTSLGFMASVAMVGAGSYVVLRLIIDLIEGWKCRQQAGE